MGMSVVGRRGHGASARWLWRACALACALAAARPLTAAAQEVSASAQGAEIRDVAFSGAQAFAPAALQAAIETSATSCTSPVVVCPFGFGTDHQRLDLETLRADVLRLRLFYYQHGYRQASVEAATTPDRRGGVRVAFQIAEGRPIRIGSLALVGAESLLPRDILDEIQMHVGDPFGTLAYEAARDTITARLADRGYPHAQVLASYDLPRDSTAVARVRFEVVPGALARIDSIRVTGTRRISPAVVRHMLTFGPRDVYRQDEILRSQRNLFGLEVFRRVEIRPDLSATDSLVPVTVDVTEGDLHRVRVGAGINTAEALAAEARWTSRNFYGGARRFEVTARISNILAGPLEGLPFMETHSGKYAQMNGSITADFVQPRFFAPMNTFGAGVFAQRQSLPLVFVQTSEGAYLNLNRALGPGTTASIGFRPELTSLDADDDRIFCVNLTLCDQSNQLHDIQVLKTPHWLSPLTFSLTRDHSNALFAPTNGSILRFDAEYANRATGSDFAYWRAVGELSEYRELVPGLVLALRVRPGFARSLAEPGSSQGLGLHPQKRFFAGGPNSVRGFAQGQLGLKVLTVDAAGVLLKDSVQGGAQCSAEQINDRTCSIVGLPSSAFDVHPTGGGSLLEGNVELRFPLGAPALRGAAFLDYGQLWNTPAEFRLRGLVWTPGLGVRYFSAIGPIRVDIAYNPQGSEELQVLSTGVGVRGSCAPPAADTPRDQLVDCGELRPVQALLWPPRSGTSWGRFLDHLQLHFSIGQAF